ncbi:hypothetical protein QEH52_17480 [Coraliomargarita sp. SDUM461003]|uniref:PEP-CTERM protein-sorting domain-containing protein n=1 Tax=Thalassobacterium maritimum TaxID=3041265 RepID=A0ABU1AYU3_9BACT|nr:hypothetical protein [Coraliomargarita sp. SDUM461003]MDQ8209323.1 hypothetical protein [Coraliomargarita sp. SDUM461003]
MKKKTFTIALLSCSFIHAHAAILLFEGLRPSTVDSLGDWRIDGGSAIGNSNSGGNFSGYTPDEGYTGGLETGTYTLTADTLELLGDGSLYDVVMTIEFNGTNTLFENYRFRQSYNNSTGNISTLTYATPTLTVYDAGTSDLADISVTFNGYKSAHFAAFSTGEANAISGTGISPISGNTSENVDITGAQDVTITASSGGIYNHIGISGEFLVTVPEPLSTSVLSGLMALFLVQLRHRKS